MQHGFHLTTVVCSRCAFVFTKPMPERGTYEAFYREAYARYYGTITPKPPDDTSDREPPDMQAKFERLSGVRPLAGAKLLELGPGRGSFLWHAMRRGCTVLGVEPSPEFCSVLTEAGIPHQQCSLGEVNPEKVGRFDIVAMFHVLEHFYDPNEALQHCAGLITPEGLLAIEVPNIDKPFRSLDRYFLRYVHPSNFCPETLQALLAKHGFRTIHQESGSDDWRYPQNLFVLAVRTAGGSRPVEVTGVRSGARVESLRRYRRRWRTELIWKWYARAWYLRARRRVPGRVRVWLKSVLGR